MHRAARRHRRRSLRLRLLAGAAALICAPAVAAQDGAAPVGADGLPPESVYFEADAITDDQASGAITARGDVLARFEGRDLSAGEVIYNSDSGIFLARGDVQLVSPDGSVQYADHLELDGDLRAGVAVNLATELEDGGKLMAATAVRRSETINELNYALFTPCDICTDEGQPKEPSWSIQAETVVQDQDQRLIVYRNALFKVAGVPILYLPVFWHPDQTVERASGFLVPDVEFSDLRGVSYEQPYLWVLSPSEDLVITPQINSEVNPLLNVTWRRRFDTGFVQTRTGYSYERNFGDVDLDGSGAVDSWEKDVRFGPHDHRAYILANGEFDPEGPWRWGFTAERVTDQTLFDRYDIEDVYNERGLYPADYRRLISQGWLERQTERSYLSIAAMAFQSLRVQGLAPLTPDYAGFEDNGILPLVAPLIEARWEPNGPVLGGRLRLEGSAVLLERADYVGAPVLNPVWIAPGNPPPGTPGLPGVDSRRASGKLDWRRSETTSWGLRWEPFVTGRFDAYSISDLGPGAEDETVTRAHATIGVDLRYPLIRRLENGADIVLEPMLQLAASPDADLDPRVPNEDSQFIELDEETLFRDDRFPGWDRYEGGVRLTAGGRASVRWGEGREASLFLGRSFRDEDENAFREPNAANPAQLFDPTGLADARSDWVVSASASPMRGLSAWVRAQIDDNADVRRAEAAIDARWGLRNVAEVRYLVDRADPNGNLDPLLGPTSRNYEFVQVRGQYFVTEHWGVVGNGIGDLQRDVWTRSETGIVYEDECLRFELVYRQDNTRVGPEGPSDGVFIRLNLAILGGSGYSRDDMR